MRRRITRPRRRRSRRPFRSSILTDERTASASEIVAGALQDHDRALVVGQTSFGKGLVQGVYNLDGGYALKLTTGKWFTPSGRTIQRPRKFVNGQFVEEQPDTNETNASKKTRPAFKSDAGRIVYGGGGITPDVIVQDDTLTTTEQQFTKAVAPKSQDFFTVLNDYAVELAKTAPPNFTVQPAWIDEFYNRLQAKGVIADRKTYDAANALRDARARPARRALSRSAIRRPSAAICRTTRRCAKRSICSRRERRSASCSRWPASRWPRRLPRRRKSPKFIGMRPTHPRPPPRSPSWRRFSRAPRTQTRPARSQKPASVISAPFASSPSAARTPRRISATTASV